MLANESSLRAYYMGDSIVKLFIKNMFFYKYWKRLLVKNKKYFCQLCVDYDESNKYDRFFLKKSFKRFIIPVAIESSYLTPFQAKVNFCSPGNANWLKSTCPSVL